MFTLTLTADELALVAQSHPALAARAKAKTTPSPKAPAPRRAARKTSPMPKWALKEEAAWNTRAARLRAGVSVAGFSAEETMRRDRITLADVIALHRGLPVVRS